MRDGFAIALLALGLLVIVVSCVGMAVLTDPMDRVHLVTPASTLGVGAVCAAVVVHEGLDASGLSAILLAAVLAATSPLVSHATARSIAVRRQEEQ
ncbi:monovalent cation/H(+) antiporter subunit G [Acidiferrimicrobium sp. IK]|uniref:monovalent cation/H(+) antiporter subunit G n=1 Tax=Acidiferrimicrobium sp. IK TaxID=2871700 RepID=UPI0021CB7DAC|nr:monovalent cation/H(+) antiporter subunit G [Acidiferrimicrobium sp. IK]MCU4182779.1 monovalent cation/H(+) antiporter subunit G [Acidiferrimicrobium sp. IK]